MQINWIDYLIISTLVNLFFVCAAITYDLKNKILNLREVFSKPIELIALIVTPFLGVMVITRYFMDIRKTNRTGDTSGK